MKTIKNFIITAIVILLLISQNPSFAQNAEVLTGPNAQKTGELIAKSNEHKAANEFQPAIEAYEEVCRLMPENKNLKQNLMSLYADYASFQSNGGNTEQAIETYEKLLAFENPPATAYIDYAKLLSAQNRNDEALTQLEKALQSGSISKNAEVKVKIDMGVIYVKKGMKDDALTILEPIAEECANAEASHIVGSIYYNMGNFEKAIKYFTASIRFSKDGPRTAQSEKILEKIKKESKTETNFESQPLQHFYIQFEGNKQNEVKINNINKALEDAYSSVGGYFNYLPEIQIPVVLYSDDQFKGLRGASQSETGHFDGKIRLPLEIVKAGESAIRRIIFHEYTHVVITMLSEGKAPLWLNEGFAQITLADQTDESKETRIKNFAVAGAAFDMTEIDKAFSDKSASAIAIRLKAYDQSYSFTKFLVEKYGIEKIMEMMTLLKSGKRINDILSSNLETDYGRLEDEWQQSISQTAK